MVKFPSGQILTFLIFLQSHRLPTVREFLIRVPHIGHVMAMKQMTQLLAKAKIRRKPISSGWWTEKHMGETYAKKISNSANTQHPVVIFFLRLDATMQHTIHLPVREPESLSIGPTTQQIPLNTNNTIYIYIYVLHHISDTWFSLNIWCPHIQWLIIMFIHFPHPMAKLGG